MYRLIAEHYEKDNSNVFIINVPYYACLWTTAD